MMLLACLFLPGGGRETPVEVKVVVVTMFERGADTGDQPGEFQHWIERERLDRVFTLPQGWRDLRMNQDGVLAVCTGIGTAKAAASVMALGLDPRFDLRKAYWLVAGIAGIDPEDGSPGSAVWAERVVDGDLAHEIDAREIPAEWPTGYIPLRKTTPYELPRREPDEGEAYLLEPTLVDWAFGLTKGIALQDTEAMRAQREKYAAPAARGAPRVLKGDVVGTFWYGCKLSAWANDCPYHTPGAATTSPPRWRTPTRGLTFLDAAGRVDSSAGAAHRQQFRSAARRHQRDGEPGRTKVGGYIICRRWMPPIAWGVSSSRHRCAMGHIATCCRNGGDTA
jgi:purine nucleoside permease